MNIFKSILYLVGAAVTTPLVLLDVEAIIQAGFGATAVVFLILAAKHLVKI